MTAIDYIVCEKSDIFMPSHGGNMGHAIQGHRAYAGHKKYITPNKRQMIPYFLNSPLPEAEFNRVLSMAIYTVLLLVFSSLILQHLKH